MKLRRKEIGMNVIRIFQSPHPYSQSCPSISGRLEKIMKVIVLLRCYSMGTNFPLSMGHFFSLDIKFRLRSVKIQNLFSRKNILFRLRNDEETRIRDEMV